MKRIILSICVLILIPLATNAATVEWSAPSSYTDNTAIAPADVARIVYTPFIGDTVSGPWVAGPKTAPGVLSATMPDPAPGATKKYTVSAGLDGMESEKAVPASKTMPVPVPNAPPGCRVR